MKFKLLHFVFALISIIGFRFTYSQHIIDSIENKISIAKEDTAKVNSLLSLSSKLMFYGEFLKAMTAAQRALALSEKLKYANGKTEAILRLGGASLGLEQPDSARYYYQTAMKISIADGYEKGAGLANQGMGVLYQYEGKLEEASNCFEKALHLMQKLGEKKSEGEILVCLGSVENFRSNYTSALPYHFAALKIFEALEDNEEINEVCTEIGYIFLNQGSYKEGLKYFERSLKIANQLHNDQAKAYALKNIGDIYLELSDYTTAKENYETARILFQQLNNKGGEGWVLSSLGSVIESVADSLIAKGDKSGGNNLLSEAMSYYEKALAIAEEMKFNIGPANVDLGRTYLKKADLSKAKLFLEKGLAISLTIENNKRTVRTAYRNLSTLDSMQGNFKQALEHYQLFTTYEDSIASDETLRKSAQLQMQYDFDKTQAIAKVEQDKKDAETKRIKIQQYFVIAGLAIIVLAVIVIATIQYRSNKHRQKANALLQQQKQKVESTLLELKSTQAQLIQQAKMASLGELTAGIAHEIQNPLNFVNNFSEVNKELITEMKTELEKGNLEEVKFIAVDIEANSERINHHGKRADSIVKGMLQHSQTTGSIKEPTDINELADEFLRLSYNGIRSKDNAFNITLKTDFDETIGKINIIPQDIGRVLLNLYNNAFYAVNATNSKLESQNEKYEPTVTVITKRIGDKVSITVKDNGNGISQKIIDKIFQPFFTTKPTGQGTGLGLSLSYDIVKAHSGEIKVETKENEGTEFIVLLPVV